MSPPVKINPKPVTPENLELGLALASPGPEENSGKEIQEASVPPEALADLEQGTQNKIPHHPLFPPDQKIDLHKILGSLDEKEQRGFLLTALDHFVKLKDEAKVQEVTGLLELSLPMFDMPDMERLGVYTLMYLSLKGSGLPQEEQVKKIGEGLAEGLVDPKATLATQVKQMILAREFFGLTENLDQLAALSKTLSNIQEEISKTLKENSALKREERIELARLGVKIDQMLLAELMIEVGHEGYEGPTIGAQILPRLNTLRKELESAPERPLEKKLSDGIFLAQALIPLKNLTQGESPQINSSELEPEFQALTQIMEKLFTEAMEQDPEAPEIQKDLAEKIVQDLKDRFAQALKNGDEGWLGQLNPKTILDFARQSQEAHLLAGKIQDLKDGQSPENIFKAADIFASMGLKGRVQETLFSMEELQKDLEPATVRASVLFKLGQTYHRAEMSTEANQRWDEIIALSKTEESPELHALAQRAHLNQLLSRGKIAAARNYLKGLLPTPEIQGLIEKMDAGLKTQRLLGGIQILSGALADYLSHCCNEEPSKNAALEKSIQSVLAETLRLVNSGEAKSFESAFKQALKSSAFSTEMGNFACESEEGSKLWGLLNSFIDPKVSEGEILQRSLILASTYSVRNYFQGVMQISEFVLNHPQANEAQRVSAKDLQEDIPTAAVMTRAFFAAQELISILSVAGNMLNTNIKMDQGYFLRLGMTVGTLGIARGVGVGAQALWVSRMESVIASPVAFRLSTIGVRSVSEAAAFPLAGMSFESLITGSTANWTFKNFGTQFGSMLVMFSFLNAHGMGLQWAGAKSQQAVQKAKQALEKAKEAGRGFAQAEKNLARAKLADSVVRHGATAWGNRITAFTESGYANEGIGLNHEEKGAAAFARVLHSVVVDAEMHVGGKLVDAASGGRLGKMERATQKSLQRHFLKTQIFKGGRLQGPLADFIRDLIDQGEVAVTDTGLVFNIKGKRGEGKSGTKKKTEPDAEAEGKMPTEAEILEEWRAVLTELVEGGEVNKALHMIRTLEKGKDFTNVSEVQRQEIKKIFGDLLRKHELIPSEEQISEQLREVENSLGEIMEAKGVFVARGSERLGLVSLEVSALTEIVGLDVLLGHLPSRYEKWQVQARILPDGKSVALEQKLPADLENVEGIRGRWMVKPIVLTADQAFQLDLVLRNPKGKLELLEPPPDLLVYRPVPTTDQGPEGGGPTGDPFSWSGFFGGAAGSRRFAPWLNKPSSQARGTENKSNMGLASLAGFEYFLRRDASGDPLKLFTGFLENHPVLGTGLIFFVGIAAWSMVHAAVQMTRANHLRNRVSKILEADFRDVREINAVIESIKNPKNIYISPREQIYLLEQISHKPHLPWEHYLALMDIPEKIFNDVVFENHGLIVITSFPGPSFHARREKMAYLRTAVENNPYLTEEQKAELFDVAFEKPDAFARRLKRLEGMAKLKKDLGTEEKDSEINSDPPEDDPKGPRKGPTNTKEGNGNSSLGIVSVAGLKHFTGKDSWETDFGPQKVEAGMGGELAWGMGLLLVGLGAWKSYKMIQINRLLRGASENPTNIREATFFADQDWLGTHYLAKRATEDPQAVFVLGNLFNYFGNRRRVIQVMKDIPAEKLVKRAEHDPQAMRALDILSEFGNQTANRGLRTLNLKKYEKDIGTDLEFADLIYGLYQKFSGPYKKLLEKIPENSLQDQAKRDWRAVRIMLTLAFEGKPHFRKFLQNLDLDDFPGQIKFGQFNEFIPFVAYPLALIGNKSAREFLHNLPVEEYFNPLTVNETSAGTLLLLVESQNHGALELLGKVATLNPWGVFCLRRLAQFGDKRALNFLKQLNPEYLAKLAPENPMAFSAMVNLAKLGNSQASRKLNEHLGLYPGAAKLVEMAEQEAWFYMVKTYRSELDKIFTVSIKGYDSWDAPRQDGFLNKVWEGWNALPVEKKNRYYDQDVKKYPSVFQPFVPFSYVVEMARKNGTPVRGIHEIKTILGLEQQKKLE